MALVGLFTHSGLLGLIACNSLPTIVPDLARESGRPPVQLEGARCPLSAAQSKAILDGLASRSPATDIFDRHLAIEEAIVGSPLTTGNQALLLQDGPATFQAMYAAILAARDHINMETYILNDDEVGQRFAQALIDKQRQGVQVNLIRDSVGTIATPEAFFQQLTDNGIKVLEFNPLNPHPAARKDWELNQRDHRKLLIVDGRTAFLGGINISGVYSGGSFRQHSRDLAGRQPALAGYRPAVAGACGCRTPEAVSRDLGGPEGRAAAGEELLPASGERGPPAGARHRQFPGRPVQPDLRHAALGDRQRRDQRAPDQCLLCPRSATACRARRWGPARRRGDADPAEPDRLLARIQPPGATTTSSCCARA